jgi:hypothetical protein
MVRYEWLYQIYVVIILLSAGFICKLVAHELMSIFKLVDSRILTMSIAGLFYLLFASFLVLFRPAFAGIERDQIRNAKLWIREHIRLK